MRRQFAIVTVFLLTAVSAFGQSSTNQGGTTGTVTATDAANNRFTLVPDNDPNSSVTVQTDAVSTQYKGFGGLINGAPEIFLGSPGFANVRTGDRVEVHGTSPADGIISADTVDLLGRAVPAPQTGVGQTRTPTSISPPTVSLGTPPSAASTAPSAIVGVVRQVNTAEGRVVIETDQHQMVTVRGSSATPVYYRDTLYRLGNLQPGDRIRVEPESNTVGGEIHAHIINVTQSVQETQGSTVEIGEITGRVTNIDRGANTARISTDRGEVRVDLANAADSSGRRVRAADLQVGDQIDLSGTYSGETFVASTVQFPGENGEMPTAPAENAGAYTPPGPLGAVTIYGTVSQSLSNSPQLGVRSSQNGETYRLYVLEDFLVRTRAGGTITADHLHDGDPIVIKAYRDSDGNYIAQTIRMR